MESNQELSLKGQELLNNLPHALQPIYITEQPNQPILLYEGVLEITQEINQKTILVSGYGKINYVWFPYPCIKFNFSTDKKILLSTCLNFSSLKFSKLKTSVEILIENTTIGESDGNKLSGRIKTPIVQGEEKKLAYAIFHLVNFHNFLSNQTVFLEKQSDNSQISLKRVSFEAESWKITLDELETTQAIIEKLEWQGGFGITHVGKIEKINGENFSGDKAKKILNIFADFLSFARGFKISLVLLVGYDEEKKEIWKHWESSRGHSYKYVDSWFPINQAQIIAEIFPSFLKCWQEEEEKKEIYLALCYYLEANNMLTVEVKIVLTQIALELIVDRDGQKKGKTSIKLRELFNKYKIPIDIPFERLPKKTTVAARFSPESPPILESLILLKEEFKQKFEEKYKKETKEKEKQKIANDLQQIDAPYLFTQVRNDIVHSKKEIENLSKYLYEVSDLGLWYLELVLLAIFNYQGLYSNRLPIYQQNGEQEAVPWSNP